MGVKLSGLGVAEQSEHYWVHIGENLNVFGSSCDSV